MSVEARPKGSRIDRYELRDRVGEGGMGNVYRAVDTKIGRTVAVKVLVPPDGRPLTDQLRERFLREVLAISRIDHPNVVKVHDYGFGEDGTPYLVMEYLEGRDLANLLRESKEPLAIEQAADIMLEVCAALRACHEVSVVHRDLKPANIFLATTESGSGWQVKIVDFGVSKAPVEGDLTEHGQIVGTWQYLSPEQVNGKAGPASDQYALGVLLYACLTRRLPYGGLKHVALLKAIDKGRVQKAPRASTRDPRGARSDHSAGDAPVAHRTVRVRVRARTKALGVREPARSRDLEEVLHSFAGAGTGSAGDQRWDPDRPCPEPRRASSSRRGKHPEAVDAEGQTEIAHYQSTTAANRGGEGALGLPLSQRHLVLPSRHPTLSDNITTTPVSRYPAPAADGQPTGETGRSQVVAEIPAHDASVERSGAPSSSDGTTNNLRRRQAHGLGRRSTGGRHRR